MGVSLGEMDTSICMAESLCCSPETTTTFLIGSTPIQNVFGVKKIKLQKWLNFKKRWFDNGFQQDVLIDVLHP